ncbi:MAG: phosphate ABC transporter substrate-binding protein [Candidatus Altiarchaeales archaeon WOR_SM1_86-2]|nr:MAG: phosphate ABC transporter substrate-binding protein [Candidatus Altiarchaeales archaeon WOR_SM1_86-2]ODS38041.1 MAG: phosphate ABC transporter substrate-binding protein [Candidatus Altiarchaeales archaeon WOR_SM1_79]
MTIGVITAFMIIIIGNSGCIDSESTDKESKTIKVSGAYALYPMMVVWADEYQKIHPNVKIEVSGGGAGKGMADALGGVVDMGMVSRDIYPEEIDKGAFYVSVAKDAVVVTINSENPVLDELNKRGVTREELVKIFITREIKTWGELVGKPEIKDEIKVYTRADACGAAQTWAEYLGDYTQEDLTYGADTGIMYDPDLAGAVARDKYAIGYNNINFAYDIKKESFVEGIRVVPIDLNENGKLDEDERVYGTRREILQAIENGIYPSPPARDLHLATRGGFKGETKEFVRWILTDGQEYIPENGYIQLPSEKIKAESNVLESGERT